MSETKGLIEGIEGKEADTTEETGAEIEVATETEEATEITEGDRTDQLKKKTRTSNKEERSKRCARPTPKRPSSSKPSYKSALSWTARRRRSKRPARSSKRHVKLVITLEKEME